MLYNTVHPVTAEARQPHPERLREFLRRLTEPMTLQDMVEESLGSLMPGFGALPAVAVAEFKPRLHNKAPESFRVGQLYQYQVITAESGKKPSGITFFTPLSNMTMPPVVFRTANSTSRSESILHAESKTGWNGIQLYFCLVPRFDDVMGQRSPANPHSRLAECRELFQVGMRAEIEIKQKRFPAVMYWGLDEWFPDSNTESLLFPLNYARSLVNPLVFRISIGKLLERNGINSSDIGLSSIKLRFFFAAGDDHGLRRLLRGDGNTEGNFAIVGNAIPMVNVDLKTWEPETSFADFVRTSGMAPLGFAGVWPFKIDDTCNKSKHVSAFRYLPPRAQLTITPEEKNAISINRFSNAENTNRVDEQVYFWMTHGSEINDQCYEYVDSEPIQPMQAISAGLIRTKMITPAFGGCELKYTKQDSAFKTIMLSLGIQPPRISTAADISHIVSYALARFGYQNYGVLTPRIEIRIVDGLRQRVITVQIQETSVTPIQEDHLKVINDYIRYHSPINLPVIVEQCNERKSG